MTPTQNLIYELLAARWRSGYTTWPIVRYHRKQLARMQADGLINYRDVDGTFFDVWLTPKAIEEIESNDHVTPLQKQYNELDKKFGDLQGLYNELAARSAVGKST